MRQHHQGPPRSVKLNGFAIAVFAALLIATGCKVNINPPASSTSQDSSGATASGTTAGSPSATGTTASPATASPSTTAGSPSTTGNTSSKAAKGTPGSAPTTTSTSGSSAATRTITSATPVANPESQPGYNPDRVFQLSQLHTADLGINGQKLNCWVADTESTRDEGLMFVKDKDIKDDQGMIFAFPQAKEQAFWMKHTYIPLDIAYIGADKKVVSTATMKPFDETNTPSHGASMYVLEMKKGTIQRLGMQKGTAIDIPPTVKAQDPPPAAPPGPGGSFGG